MIRLLIARQCQGRSISTKLRFPCSLKPRCLSSAASSNLLGHSPMAPQMPSSSNAATSHIPTALDVTTSGGVWAPSSAKREKLKELQGELAEHKDPTKNRTLDDMATPEELLDLYLADGLSAIVSSVEKLPIVTLDAETVLNATIKSVEELIPLDEQLTQTQWEATLTDISKMLESRLTALPPDRCLKNIRDFYVPSPLVSVDVFDTGNTAPTLLQDTSALPEHDHASEATVRFRLTMTQAAVDHLRSSWKTLTSVSDQDVDRAAVTGIAVEKEATTLSAVDLKHVLTAYLTRDCAGRTEPIWGLVDRDSDGLMDESEIIQVCQLMVEPVRKALTRLFQEATDASPVRASHGDTDLSTSSVNHNSKRLSWRQRRREAKVKKQLVKLFQHTVNAHFVDEVEMPHRMRCLYAWANKAHQDNKTDSVLVDDIGWTGRKRYVELHPKISYSEFKEIQSEHFQHLDGVGGELIKGFRQHLWIMQGRQRQRRQLYRNGMLFLIGISILDYAILVI